RRVTALDVWGRGARAAWCGGGFGPPRRAGGRRGHLAGLPNTSGSGKNRRMSFYVDLHLHSRYARATSRNADLPELAWWARRKGITLLGTGDFTHPVWFEELRDGLVPAEPGLFRLRDELDRAGTGRLPPSCQGPLRFLWATEVSTAFHRDGRARRMHHLLYVPGLEVAAALTDRLGRGGNRADAGRPTLAMDARDRPEAPLDRGDGARL